MKILHINSYFNGSKFYKNLYDKQVQNGLDISVYVPVPSTNNLNAGDLGEYTIVSANHNKFDRFLFQIKHYKILKDIVKKIEVDRFSILHAHSLFSNGSIALKLKQKYNVPYIVAVRNTDVNFFFKKMPHLRNLGIKILKEADGIVLLSESYKNLLKEKYIPNNLKDEIDKKISIVPNGINNFWFQNIETKESIPFKDDLKLLHVGVIDKNKNITTTIKAIEILHNKGYNVTFTLVGRIKNENVYRKIKDLPYINYFPPKPQEELMQIYRENDIFVMPSITETFGLVYAEAMSQGLPVIYSQGQGFDRQFENGTVGASVPSDSETDIANQIQNILVNYHKISVNCTMKVDKFHWGNIVEQYSQLYSKLIN
ncbi:glycosyltransferase family 4 protein [Oceanobacillus sp. FSL W7-1304]|uniref:glycosyltransferase family 4 protein n=1 Tax=Oceanobacillus sp. FSL W7-1304 TaxID=2975322 RepID=UPI0030D9330E